MSQPVAAPRPDLDRLMRPRSIAVAGASSNPGATANRVVSNLERFGFAGEIHLVSRTGEKIGERSSVAGIAALPHGVDLVVLAIPGAAVKAAVAECAAAGVGAIVVYASGFAEMGPEGLAEQSEIAAIAREAGIALLGPNCIGLTNFVDGIPLGFGVQQPNPPRSSAVAVIGQSGGMVGNIRLASAARDLPVSYTISTGNEAVLAINDFVEFVLGDDITRVIVVFAEQIREPIRFLALAAEARRRNKIIVLLHPGRSAAAQAAAQSHTGSVASDHAVMRTLVSREAVLVVDTLDEMFDVVDLLVRFPAMPEGGPVILTESGAFKGLAADFCDGVGLALPQFSDAISRRLATVLPDFATVSNPLDVTAQGLRDVGLYGASAAVALEDPAVGSAVVVLMPGSAELGVKVAEATLPALKASGKPVVYVLLGDASPVAPQVVQMMRDNAISFFRSPDRALRALARLEDYSRALARASDAAPAAIEPLVVEGSGVLPEFAGKGLLARVGVPTPEGGLATNREAAVEIARTIGYPVVAKAQSAALAHKSDVGGVALDLRDDDAVRAAWDQVHRDVAAGRPDVALDGVLVERMAPRGLEMIVAARRDPDWGPVLMAGLGGVWIEALDDVKLLSVDLSEDEIVEEIRGLKAARLLDGFRGAPPVDVAAAAAVLARLGRLLRANPAILEIEVNPLTLYPEGQGAVALDALVTLAS